MEHPTRIVLSGNKSKRLNVQVHVQLDLPTRPTHQKINRILHGRHSFERDVSQEELNLRRKENHLPKHNQAATENEHLVVLRESRNSNEITREVINHTKNTIMACSLVGKHSLFFEHHQDRPIVTINEQGEEDVGINRMSRDDEDISMIEEDLKGSGLPNPSGEI